MGTLCSSDGEGHERKRIMIETKEQFLEQLEKGLLNHPKKKEIVLEYDLHLTEMLIDDSEDPPLNMSMIIERVGSPEEILEAWKEEFSVTPRKAKWNFVFFNLLFFSLGILLTLLHNLFAWEWTQILWRQMTSVSGLIILLYILFWALLGYEIGKTFGPNGRSLMFKTFLLSVIPNLILLSVTVLHIIPHNWFEPLLTREFIVICVVFTFMLYPVCILGYKWGKKVSV